MASPAAGASVLGSGRPQPAYAAQARPPRCAAEAAGASAAGGPRGGGPPPAALAAPARRLLLLAGLARRSRRRRGVAARRRAGGGEDACAAGPRRFPDWLEPEAVPRLPADGAAAAARVAAREPVVLEAAPLCASAVGRWNFEYLEAEMADFAEWPVHVVPQDRRCFQRVYGEGIGEGLVAPMTFAEFASKSVARDLPHSFYLQAPLLGQDLRGFAAEDPYAGGMRGDADSFAWPWLRDLLEQAELGGVEHNQLWVGRGGNLTPCHHDTAENFHAQILGWKRFLIIPPDETFNIYPYPIAHPLDTFSMVDFDDPDLMRFPRLRRLRCFEAVLRPGDVLYLPLYWWHQVAQGMGDNISLNFWCGQRAPPLPPDATGFQRHAQLFASLPARCRPLLAHRLAEDFVRGAARAGALPPGLAPGRFLTELAQGLPADAPEAARRLGADLRRLLGELLGGGGQGLERADEVLRGATADGRLHPGPPRPPDREKITVASNGAMGGWLSVEPR